MREIGELYASVTWTNIHPWKPGYYWFKPKKRDPIMVHVVLRTYPRSQYLVANALSEYTATEDIDAAINSMDGNVKSGKWCGPLLPPEKGK